MPRHFSNTPGIKVTIDELAALFRVSRSTVKNWNRDEIIKPCVRIGNVVRFDLADCERRLGERSRGLRDGHRPLEPNGGQQGDTPDDAPE